MQGFAVKQMKYCIAGAGPYGAGGPFGQGQTFDPEDILKSFFGGRDSPFGSFRSGGMDFEDGSQMMQVQPCHSVML